MGHRPALLARQPLPVHRESLPLRQPRQWARRLRLWQLHRPPRPERPLHQRQQRKPRPHRQRRGERPQPRLQRRSRPESAEAIVTAKVVLPLHRPRVVRTKRRLNAPPASAAKLRARKEPAKPAARRRAKGARPKHPKNLLQRNQALPHNVD
jgi:hypothetical protein